MRVMVADDSGFIREILQQALLALDCHVVAEAESGPEVLPLFEKIKPEILFLDLVLPEMNGLEVAQKILQAHPDAKIIAMSSLSDEWMEQQVIRAGCLSFLKKPFNHNAIKSAYERARQGRQDVKYGGI